MYAIKKSSWLIWLANSFSLKNRHDEKSKSFCSQGETTECNFPNLTWTSR